MLSFALLDEIGELRRQQLGRHICISKKKINEFLPPHHSQLSKCAARKGGWKEWLWLSEVMRVCDAPIPCCVQHCSCRWLCDELKRPATAASLGRLVTEDARPKCFGPCQSVYPLDFPFLREQQKEIK